MAGTIIVLSGAKGAYTSALSQVVAEVLGWKHARFSDFIRLQATANGENPDDTRVLQRIGQKLVEEQVADFVSGVLGASGWQAGENLVLDGLRHADVYRELKRQVASVCEVRVVYVGLSDRAARADRVKRSEGVSDEEFKEYDRDATETQVEEAPSYSNLEVSGAEPRGELARTIIRRFVPDFIAPVPQDDGDTLSLIEPMTTVRTVLSELARELITEAGGFAREVPAGLEQPLADLVRAMNCYYSNLIEGSNAAPVDIELALDGDYERDDKKRHLQAEAKAHIAVQRWIDAGNLGDESPATVRALTVIHDRFFSEFPDARYLPTADGSRGPMVIPGALRNDEIQVGRHRPPSPGSIPRFMKRFEQVYAPINDPEQAILALAPAHHRLLWIHPFADGNGRVARLMSDASLGRVLNTHGLWSVSRGLAQHEQRYKGLLQACDEQRQGDFDGRGNLSEKFLAEFTHFFLSTCLEQARLMRKAMRLDEIGALIDRWIETRATFGDKDASDAAKQPLHRSGGRILKALIEGGPLSFAECRSQLDAGDDIDAVVGQLSSLGFARVREGIVSFALPAHRAERFLPGLFP